LTSTKPEIKARENPEAKKILDSLTDFQYLLMTASMDLEVLDVLKSAFRFFIHEEVSLSLDPP